MTDVDIAVVGGGIVGLAVARELLRRAPGLSLCVLEKEQTLASHQTGRNSGVIHAGVYYAPGSLKARFCRQGSEATSAFCREHAIPFEQCGKLVVATAPKEMARLDALYERGRANGLVLERLDAAELRRREANITGLAALLVPTTGIVDYGVVAQTMAAEIRAAGAEVWLGAEVVDLRDELAGVTLQLPADAIRARHAIVCAGLGADQLARLGGIEADFRIVAFRGEYFRLAPRHDGIVRHLIYPVPDPALPFLGVHLTRMIGGYVTVGPNAVLAFAQEGYTKGNIDPAYLMSLVGYAGFRKLVRRDWRNGVREMANSLMRRRYLALCRRYCPDLALDDLLLHPAGVRAQAVLRDGTLVHDFLIERSAHTIHVCNAPSPAATSAIPIARHIVDEVASAWDLRLDPESL